MSRIYYTKPSITDLEIRYATDAAANGWGERCYEYIDRFEESFKEHLGVNASQVFLIAFADGGVHVRPPGWRQPAQRVRRGRPSGGLDRLHACPLPLGTHLTGSKTACRRPRPGDPATVDHLTEVIPPGVEDPFDFDAVAPLDRRALPGEDRDGGLPIADR